MLHFDYDILSILSFRQKGGREAQICCWCCDVVAFQKLYPHLRCQFCWCYFAKLDRKIVIDVYFWCVCMFHFILYTLYIIFFFEKKWRICVLGNLVEEFNVETERRKSDLRPIRIFMGWRIGWTIIWFMYSMYYA